MPKGGARTRSGVPPNPNALRRERDKPGEWVDLPPDGREGPPPDWPLTKPTKRELGLWVEEWRRPQAIMWEAHGLVREVALYVRSLRQAEQPRSSVALRQLVKQYGDLLGLSAPALRSLRWRIVGETQVVERPPPELADSVKMRLKVVQGGGSA